MPQEKRHLSETAEREIKELQAKGLTLTHDDIVWINDLAREVENPSGGSTLPAGRPARAGNVWLHPFTIAGIAWYEMVLPWFDGEDEYEILVLAYALAKGREADTLSFTSEYDDIKRALKKWKREIRATQKELTKAVAAVLPQTEHIPLAEDADKPAEDSAGWGEIVATMVATCGGTPEMWECRVSKDYLFEQMRVMNAQNVAGDKKPNLNDPQIKAIREMGRCTLFIQRREQDG